MVTVELGYASVNILEQILEQHPIAAIAYCVYQVDQKSDPQHEGRLHWIKTEEPKRTLAKLRSAAAQVRFKNNFREYDHGQRAVSLASIVETEGGALRHIPMLDIGPHPVIPLCSPIIKKALEYFPKGHAAYLAKSGDGLHLWVNPLDLLSLEELKRVPTYFENVSSSFLTLMESHEYAALRIAACPPQKNRVPEIIAIGTPTKIVSKYDLSPQQSG